MYNYATIQWLFFFYFYCFFGWCFESTYVSIKNKRPVNRGFMRGPFLPLYGTGAIMMLLVSMPFQENILLVYVAGCLGATLLEYVTGVAMEALFKVRYWDYSDQKFNFQGHICLSSTLAWGLLTILMTEYLHKPVEWFVLRISLDILTPVTLVLTAFICADFALSFKAAMDLRDVLIGMEKAKEELLRIQKRLDVMIAVTNEDITNRRENISESLNQYKEELTEGISQYREELAESVEGIRGNVEARVENIRENVGIRVEDLKKNIEDRLERMKKRVQTNPGDYLDNLKDELLDLKVKYLRNIEEREGLSRLKNFLRRDLLHTYPSMSSVRFKEALEELKQRVEEMHKGNKE